MLFKLLFILLLRKIKSFFSIYRFYLATGYIPPRGCVIENINNLSVGNDFTMGTDCKLFSQDSESKIIIGDRVSLNYCVSLNADGGGSIILGDNTIIGPNTVLRASNHRHELLKKPIRDQGHSSGKIVLGGNVWVGASVVILPNVTIGNNVIVGAGSVVTKDIADNLIVAGVPAVTIKKRVDL